MAKTAVSSGNDQSHSGHRERMRIRFQKSGLTGMLDYEVLESLLMLVIPRSDVKPLAKRLLNSFGTVSRVLDAPLEELAAVKGLGPTSATGLKLIRSVFDYCLEENCRESEDLLDNLTSIKDFARMKIGGRPHECYMMIYLNAHNRLIDYQIIAEGTVDYVYAYSRNALEWAMKLGASAAVMVHNHPSGVCHPSHADLHATEEMVTILFTLGIRLVDHLIISRNNCFSFAENSLLPKPKISQPRS